MKLSLPRADLVKALDFVARTVERRSTIPILSNVRIVAISESLRFTATDLDAEAICRIDAKVDEPGALTVPAARLHDIVRKLDEKAQVSLAADESSLTVKAGRARFTLQTLPVSDWPDLSPGEMPHAFTLPVATLARALQKTAFAISNEETRYYLGGVFMHVAETADGPKLRLVATDGHRLARFETEAPEGAAKIPGIIIPRKACSELAKMAKEAPNKDATARISLSSSKIRVEIDHDRERLADASASDMDVVLLSKLIDGSYPDYERVIPRQNDKRAELDLEAFARAVDRVSTIASERGRAIKLEFGASERAVGERQSEPQTGILKLSVVNADLGSASEEQEADYSAAPLEIGFNAVYLREILGNFEGDRVRVDLNDGGSPTILTSPHDSDLLVVIMPMRV